MEGAIVGSLPEPNAMASGTADAIDVLVVAVTYNSADVIDRFVTALPAAIDGIKSTRVVVVDNGSTDSTVPTIEELAPWVRIVASGVNRGYARGINLGMQQADARRGVMILNPDTEPQPGSIRELVDAAEARQDTGITVPRIVDLDGRLSHSLRREPTITRALGEALIGGRRSSRWPLFGEVVSDAELYVNGAIADWATGAAMYLSRRVLDTVGHWTEDYFLYSEETDYALRARDAGLSVRYVPAAEVVHRGGDLQTNPWLWSLQALNRTRLYRRRHGRVASAAFWSAVVLNEALRSVTGAATHRAALRALFFGHQAINDRGHPMGSSVSS